MVGNFAHTPGPLAPNLAYGIHRRSDIPDCGLKSRASPDLRTQNGTHSVTGETGGETGVQGVDTGGTLSLSASDT